jgi:two-component system OmpR family response regulator
MRPANVLVVDDDKDTLNLLQMALEAKGFRVAIAAEWNDITQHIEVTYRRKTPIDVIVLDLMMPDRSGFDIIRALKVILNPMPPVIMLSAVTGIEQQLEAIELGASKYITKPTTPHKLIDTIERVLADQRRSD